MVWKQTMQLRIQRIVSQIRVVGSACLVILILNNCETGIRDKQSLALLPFFETPHNSNQLLDQKTPKKVLSKLLANNTVSKPSYVSIHDLIEIREIKGVPKTTQAVIAKTMKEILRENKYLTLSTTNSSSKKI